MINQLFKRRPNKEELKKILNCYGLKTLDSDNLRITIYNLEYIDTINKLNNILYILTELYLNCKYHFIENITNRKAITILRQILRLYNKKMKFYNSKRFIPFYKIYNIELKSKIKINNNVKLKF